MIHRRRCSFATTTSIYFHSALRFIVMCQLHKSYINYNIIEEHNPIGVLVKRFNAATLIDLMGVDQHSNC